jgi:hypothetical protein
VRLEGLGKLQKSTSSLHNCNLKILCDDVQAHCCNSFISSFKVKVDFEHTSTAMNTNILHLIFKRMQDFRIEKVDLEVTL